MGLKVNQTNMFSAVLIFTLLAQCLAVRYIEQDCKAETGYCLGPDGHDQNQGQRPIRASTKEDCFAECQKQNDGFGCEWSSVDGCQLHTQKVSGGSGSGPYVCWVFSKCSGSSSGVRINRHPDMSGRNYVCKGRKCGCHDRYCWSNCDTWSKWWCYTNGFLDSKEKKIYVGCEANHECKVDWRCGGPCKLVSINENVAS